MHYTNIIIKHIFLLVIIFNAKSQFAFASITSSRIVRTKYGELSGIVSTPSDRLDAVEIFRGVPYALPPVGHLRFMPPVSGAQWSGVKVADRFSPVCPQNLPRPARTNNTNANIRGRLDYLHRLIPYLTNQSEDCLYLNIYAPAQGGSRESGQRKYPVMVFIHGESYEWNSGNPYDGSVLASYGGVVVVTVNYRLGILGFLNTNTDVHMRMPSNYGLMDQIAALHWIQENIGFFNGDPSNVTLVGHGTGAACVNFLMISPAVPDGLLFHRAILMSGSSLSPWALVRDPARYARQVAKHAACPIDLSHTELLRCLREKPLELLLSTPVLAPEFTTAFGPSIDGVIIDTGLSETRPSNNKDTHSSYDYHTQNSPGRPSQPSSSSSENINEAIAAGGYGNAVLSNVIAKKAMVSKLTRYDLLLGVVKAEAFFTFTGDDIQYGIEPDRRSKILRTFVKNTYRYHLSEILATIINEYTDWERPVQHPINIRDETLEALSDAMVVAPTVNTADLHSSARRNSYLYVFDYQTKNGDYQQRQGCIHGEELPYLFGAPLVAPNHFSRNFTKSEIMLSEATIIYFSNFARSGNPNDAQDGGVGSGGDILHNNVRAERSKFKNIEWTAYESVHKKYLSLDMKPKLKNHYRAHRLSFWLNLVPDLHKPGTDDVPKSHHMLSDDEDMNEIPHSTSSPGKKSPPSSYQNYGPSASHNLLNLTNDILHQASASVVKVAPSSGRDVQEELNESSQGQGGQEDGFAAYSTALSVTVAIGCSLLILNVLIFAGVYYQRDKSRGSRSRGGHDSVGSTNSNASSNGSQNGTMIKQRRQENGGPMSNISADYLYVSGAPELLQIVDSRSSPRGGATGSILKKGPPLDHHIDQYDNQGSSILVLQPPHRYPPIEFQDVKISCSSTLPRPPPPPRLPESQPLLSSGGTLGRYKPRHKTIDELKV
uniref:Neuroligin-4, Y-linked n=1 Tax=Cacopsylla melanoneura TaxID=428564 RepID=A0A8D9E0V9_9HEMI